VHYSVQDSTDNAELLAGALTDTTSGNVWSKATSLLAKIKWADKRTNSVIKIPAKEKIRKQS
jgi:hypothetical protein